MEQRAMRQRKAGGRLSGQAARQSKTAESGQTLLEFAFMLPFMMLLLLGIAEIGRAAFITITINNAATAGAEYGSQNDKTASDFTGMQQAAFCDANGQSTINCNAGILTQTPVATNGCTCDTGGVSCFPMPGTGTCTPTFSCQNGQQIVECVQVTTHAD